MPRTPRLVRALAGIAALLVPVAVTVPTQAAAPAGSRSAPSDTSRATGTVTLVTGDRVTIGAPAAGRPSVIVDPADDRSSGFSVRRDHGDVSVIPNDVTDLVPEILDPALFDVTSLLEMGYGDAQRDSLPLIVHRAAGVSTLEDDSPLTATAKLPSIDATASALPKADADEFGDDLAAVRAARPGTTAKRLDGATRIWLDSKVEATALDPYLQRVKAAAAWDSGLDGSGVEVAVLDTGVDAGHPALEGSIDEQQNFTDEDSAADGNGHGTHVTSLIVGNGAGADGARHGIARGVDVLSGKVLDDHGQGLESWVIAGMEWAADQDADIVNLSLGGPPTVADDPVALALDRLTAESGTLFVVAAGNRSSNGRHPETIDTPGSAAAALTVGATHTDNDGAAGFSGQGPTRGTYRLKPDVAAPGVGILGARAGARTGDLYIPMTGTSQATPIIAGAAALIAQQHPDWGPARLKARVVTTADQGEYYSPWRQGGGRLNLERATAATLTSDTASLDFGYVKHPDESARQRQVTLHNPGSEPVTVTATDQQSDEGGTAATVRAVTVSPATITVPAGGSASTTVRFDPATVADGIWHGGLSFVTGDKTVLRLPFGAYDEPERYDVHVTVLDRNGDPYGSAAAAQHPMADHTVSLFNADNGYSYRVPLDENGEGTARVTRGHYGVVARIATPTDTGKVSFTFANTPETEVSRDVDFVIDARDAKRLRPPRVAGQSTTVEQATLVSSRHGGGRGLTEYGFFSPAEIERGLVYVQPTESVRTGQYDTDLAWRLEPTGETRPKTPDAYELDFTGHRLPDTTGSRLTRRDISRLARVESDYHALARPSEASRARTFVNSNTGLGVRHDRPVDLPADEVDLRTASADVQWSDCLDLTPDANGNELCGTMHSYQRGSRVTNDLDSAIHPTAVAGYRTPDGLRVETGLGDGRHSGKVDVDSTSESSLVLRNRGGDVLGSNSDTFGFFGVPSAARRFSLVQQWTLPAGWITTSSRTRWTFHSAPPVDPTQVGSTPLPLMTVDYGPRVDGRGFAKAGRKLPLDLSFGHVDGADATRRVSRARLWWSSDDGERWHRIRVGRSDVDAFRAKVPARALVAGRALSLRVDARDAERNSIRQSAIGLVPVR